MVGGSAGPGSGTLALLRVVTCLALELTTWSMACIEKLNVMNSTIGLRSLYEAPMARPAKPISVMGVSITRWSPYLA